MLNGRYWSKSLLVLPSKKLNYREIMSEINVGCSKESEIKEVSDEVC